VLSSIPIRGKRTVRRTRPELAFVRRIRVVFDSGSRRGTIVVVQHAAQTLTAQHRTNPTRWAFTGHDQPVRKTLVVSLDVIMQNELINSSPQRAFAKEDHSVHAEFLDAANEPFRVSVRMSLQMRRMATLKVDVSE